MSNLGSDAVEHAVFDVTSISSVFHLSLIHI